jgi:hypothetical protein
MLLRGRVANFIFSYKHSTFSEEREWRLVSLQASNDSKRLGFRPGNGFLVPYIGLELHWKVGPNIGKLPISKIILGPTLHPESDTPRGAGGLMGWAVSKTAGPWV